MRLYDVGFNRDSFLFFVQENVVTKTLLNSNHFHSFTQGKGLLRKVDLEPKLVRLKEDILSGKYSDYNFHLTFNFVLGNNFKCVALLLLKKEFP